MDRHLVSFLNPTSFEAEQYRRLRQRIEELRQTRRTQVLAVTSPVASDGKTLTAANLAGSARALERNQTTRSWSSPRRTVGRPREGLTVRDLRTMVRLLKGRRTGETLRAINRGL